MLFLILSWILRTASSYLMKHIMCQALLKKDNLFSLPFCKLTKEKKNWIFLLIR